MVESRIKQIENTLRYTRSDELERERDLVCAIRAKANAN